MTLQSHNVKSVSINIANQQNILPVTPRFIRRVVRHVLNHFSHKKVSVSVALVDNAQIRKLKKQFFHRSEATDVISFNLADSDDSPPDDSLDCEIVVNAQRALQWAQKHNSDPLAEFSLYLVHGLLHQLGFDDRTAKLAKIMHEEEDRLLNRLGFGPVYYRKG